MKNTHISHISSSSRRKIQVLERRRRKAARLFQKKIQHAKIARQCGVSRAAVRKWYVSWKKSGVRGLRSQGRLGRKPELTSVKINKVRRVLLKGPNSAGFHTNVWTLERISRVFKETVHLPYHPGHVWKILQAMGWSCQKPQSRAKERDEKAIKQWRKIGWPRIQKRGQKSARSLAF